MSVNNFEITDEELQNIIETYNKYLLRCLSLGEKSQYGDFDGLLFSSDEDGLYFADLKDADDISKHIYDDIFILPDVFYGLGAKFWAKELFKGYSVKKIKFGDRLKKIGYHFYYKTLDFTNIELDEVDLGGVSDIDTDYFSRRGKTKKIVGRHVQNIDFNAFSQNKLLEEVYFPNVIHISNKAFEECTNLKSIELVKCKELGKYVFYNCLNLESVLLSDELSLIDSHTFYGCSNLNSINLNNINTIGVSAFELNEGLFNIDISSCEILEKNAFNECINLRNVLVDRLLNIKESAFAKCYNLDNIDLSKVEIIGDQAFVLTKLNKANLSNVKSLGDRSFYSSKLENVYLGSNVNKISKECFNNNPLKIINLDNIKRIEDFAFVNTLLEEVDLRNCEYIGRLAFYNTKLRKIKISDDLRIVGDSAFENINGDLIIEYYGKYKDFKDRLNIGKSNDRFINAKVVFV